MHSMLVASAQCCCSMHDVDVAAALSQPTKLRYDVDRVHANLLVVYAGLWCCYLGKRCKCLCCALLAAALANSFRERCP